MLFCVLLDLYSFLIPFILFTLFFSLSSFPSLFSQVADYYGEGQDQIFAISGGGDTSSLRIIRNGLAVNIVTSTPRDFAISGLWVVDKFVVCGRGRGREREGEETSLRIIRNGVAVVFGMDRGRREARG
jgi:hypothetical protein